MGGINQIINIYSNINRMTDQQKGYGLGIILGISLPCPRGARSARRWPRPLTAHGARTPPLSLSLRISPLHTYIEINLIKTLILFVLKTI